MSLTFRPMIIPSWIDYVGGMRDSFWSIQGAGASIPMGLQLTVGAAAFFSDCGLLAMTYQSPQVESPAPIEAAYNVLDAATFYFTSSGGQQGVISVPAPYFAIFKSDGVTVDLTNVAVIQFVSYVGAYLGDSAGNPWTQLRMAVRTRFPG